MNITCFSDYSPVVHEFNDGFRIERVSRVDGHMLYLNCERGKWYGLIGAVYKPTRFETREQAEVALAVYLLTQ